jgi:hypothetical protein
MKEGKRKKAAKTFALADYLEPGLLFLLVYLLRIELD